jgi:putative transposase
MRGPTPRPIQLTSRQRAILEQIVRRATSVQREVLRARLLLAMADGQNNEQVARQWHVTVKAVRIWRRRWLAVADRLAAVEAEEADKALNALIRAVLDDQPRSGRPALFMAEQICSLIAVACEEPEASGRPISHWTPRELADEVVRRAIVAEISPRSVGRFLKSGGPQTPSVPLLAQPRPGGRSGSLRSRGKNRV